MKKVNHLLYLLLLSSQVFAQSSPKEDPRFSGLDKTFNGILHDWHVAGMAIAVVEKDKIIYARGFGYADVEKKQPVTPNTVFSIGSCSKAFTASLLGILREEGKLSFDVPVRNYLPSLHFATQEMNDGVTLRDMMSHRTGLPRIDMPWYLFTPPNRDSLLSMVKYIQPSDPLRYKWQYSNVMFVAQGAVAEKITGKSWEENIAARIFTPLGMTRSTTGYSAMKQQQDIALPYEVKDSSIVKTRFRNTEIVAPAGAINSSALDMAAWVAAWINNGKYKGTKVLPEAYVREAKSAQMIMTEGLPSSRFPDIYFSTYGLGWVLQSYKGHYGVFHDGNIDGYSAITCFYPTDSIGFVILVNQSLSPAIDVVKNILSDKLLGLKSYDWNGTKLKAYKEIIASQPKDTGSQKPAVGADVIRPLSDYTGLYSSPAFGAFEVVKENDSLYAFLPQDTVYLKHYSYDVFQPESTGKYAGQNIMKGFRWSFRIDERGKIADMSFRFDQKDPYIFTRTEKLVNLDKATLEKYTGIYVLGGVEMKVYLKEDKLMFFIPGQPEYTLEATKPDNFSIKGLRGYDFEFTVNDNGIVTDLTITQPNGQFKAKKKI